ncbi:MAG: leucine--tRNA ligase [Anaerolineales bacterium]|nr:leucine--tRNA ligase [Anaerolineales bacterium]
MITSTGREIAPYDPAQIEPHWQAAWEKAGLYTTPVDQSRPKFYCLDFFPYPSGEGLHVGHCRNYVPTDVIARYKRMQGYDVLHPMGWDAFGEPAEQFAIAHGVHPRHTTDRNAANYKRQMRLIGTSYDWEREIDSSRPEYYRWTQWFFLQFYRRGLAYRDTNWQWWCPQCATTLSSHEIDGETCWRGHRGVTKREIPAWYFKITSYADELISGLDEIDWPEPIKRMQTHWIGRSDGAIIHFPVSGQSGQDHISVFTTRPDTLYGVTFLALAPEHPMLAHLVSPGQRPEVEAYRQQTLRLSEIERLSEGRKVTGVFTGGYVRHPLTKSRIPVYIADYVLPTYGEGAVMGVPAHDQRDFEFARQSDLPGRPVVVSARGDEVPVEMQAAWEQPGYLVNSGQFDGLSSEAAGRQIIARLTELGAGRAMVTYRLRDWLISRQRYWGTPIPIIHCPNCGEVPVPEAELPVLLPEMEDFAPDGSGRSPLARLPEFLQVDCPQCNEPAQRETDTMGGFACSSWYFLRFANPHYHQGPFDPEAVHQWLPVDLYVGGAEHAVLHLLYARFWTRALADLGLLPFREPFTKLINQGQLHGPDGQRMSKSRGNVITPDEIVAQYGADALRIYGLFMAPFEQNVDWNTDGINGARRFLNRVWNLYQEYWAPTEVSAADPALRHRLHETIRDVSERIEGCRFNTMLSALMAFVNDLQACTQDGRWRSSTFRDALEVLPLLLAPAAPHLAEALWAQIGQAYSVHQQAWPSFNPQVLVAEQVEIPVQINGRKRGVVLVPVDAKQEQVFQAAADDPVLRSIIQAEEIARVVYVPGKILNIVTR